MPKCGGIAAIGKLLSPQGDRETTDSPTVCFQDPCIHHHPLSPAFDGCITCSTFPTAEPTVKQRRSPSGRAQGRAQEPESAGMNLHSTAGQQWSETETPSACGNWCNTEILSSSCAYVTVQQWNGKHGMQGSGVGALGKVFYKGNFRCL